ncbi:hypothetical protein [Sorangium sp. So ce388]|uniref:hypothetical protein n=1 Tax=Sorangium sp. So ce388 TaxID=3133309 RepID=UPI003F5C4E4E
MSNSIRDKIVYGSNRGFSIRERAAKVGWTDGSLRGLMNEFSPQTRVFESTVKAGDVDAAVRLYVASNGEYDFYVQLHDSGTLFGDSYSLAVALNRAAPDNTAFGIWKQGDLDDGETRNIEETGRSEWLRNNWALVQPPTGMRVHLKASVDVEFVDILPLLFLGVGVVFGGLAVSRGCDWENRDGSAICRVRE